MYIFKILLIITISIMNLFSKDLYLTKQEIQYLKNKKTITYCIDPFWMPYESIADGKHVGISKEYLDLLEKKINTKFVLVKTNNWTESLNFVKEQKCDIHSLIGKNSLREKYLDFSNEFISSSLVLATKSSEVFISNMNTLKNKKIALIKNYYYHDYIKSKYKNLNFVDVNNLEEGIVKVSKGEVFGIIASVYSISYLVQKKFYGQIKISSNLEKEVPLFMATLKENNILIDIFNKALKTISKKQKQEIENKWISIKYEKNFNKILLFAFIVLLFVVFIVLFFDIKFRAEINRRKDLENLHELTIKGANLCTWLWDIEKKELTLNSLCSENLSYEKYEIKSKNDIFKIISKRDLSNFLNSFNSCLNSYKKSFECEIRMKDKFGDFKWVYINGAVVKYNQYKKPLIIAGIKQDINDRKNLEYELLKQKDLLIQQSRQAAMGEMLENIAHQWRQPLSMISICASSISFAKQRNKLDDKLLLNSMDNITSATDYLSQTIDDFRNFFNKDKLLNYFSVQTLLDNSTRFLKSKMENRNIELITNINNQDTIFSYENELVQCLINIFNNAIDAIESNILTNTKKLVFFDSYFKEDNLIIKIKDNALGIKKDVICRIFEPYYTTKHKSQGTGIGLYMTSEIITKHLNGEINVKNNSYIYNNQEYKGALFTIIIPKKLKENN